MTSLSRNPFWRLIAFIANIGVEPEDSPELRLRKALISFSVSVVCFVFLVFTGPIYFRFHEPLAGALYIGFALSSLVGLFLFALRPDFFRIYRFLVLSLALVAELAGTIALGGFMNSSGLPIWGLLTVQGSLVHYGPRRSLYWFFVYLVVLTLSVSLQPFLRPENNLPHSLVLILFLVNLTLVSGITFLSLNQFVKQRDHAFALLREERQKSENLLLNILPLEIAGILKNGKSTIADHYEAVSILFADVVDFTPMSEKMTPTELVEILNEVFSHFDTLAEKYGVEKIKTIGDCYMAASGVPRSRPDHAHALVRMALEMREYAREREFAGRGLLFRMGINSGSVVAGVIGRKKFIYDLWGDAVNTASRMESHGGAGAIQVTQATHELIKDGFLCEPRGLIQVKGKGEMRVWHVLGERLV